MLSLTDNDYKKKLYCAIDNNFYWIISPVADGNCGLYAFACGLIDAITRHELILDPSLFDKFKKKLLEDLSSCTLKKLLTAPSVNFNQFKNFLLQQHSRESLSNLAILFSTTLRKIGYDVYLELLLKEAQVINSLEKGDKKLRQDGNYIGFEILVALANYFKIEIGLVGYNANINHYYWAHTPLNNSKPLFSLLNLKSHWNYLLPIGQFNGLAQFLKEEIDPSQSKPLLENTNNILKKNIARLPNVVKLLTEELKKTFHLNESFNSDQKKLIRVDENLCSKRKFSSCLPWFFSGSTPETPDVLSTPFKVRNR